MIDLARPGFLWAGAALALGPLLLHLLRPVERSRKTLPTSRFLTPDPKRRVRLHRKPDERILLLLRMSLCLLLGAAFAGVGWVGPERGVASLVVVDGGSALRDRWTEAREALAAPPADRDGHVVIVRPGPELLPEIERLGAGAPSPEEWAASAPTEEAGPVRLAHMLRAARTAAKGLLGYDSIAVQIVTDPSWQAWVAGTARLRETIWPGAIGLTIPDSAVVSAGDARAEAGPAVGTTAARVALRAPTDLRAPLARALEALGLTVDTSRASPTGPEGRLESTVPAEGAGPADVILSVGPDPDGWEGLWLAEAGAGDADGGAPDAFLLLDGRTFPGAGSAPGGTPAAGTTVSLLRVGGRPAAAARRTGAGCRVVLPMDPRAPILGSADLPLVLEGALDSGCGLLPEAPGAETAFRHLLDDGSRPRTVATAAIRDAGAGRPLERWILALALLVAMAETWTSRRIETRRRGRD